MALVCGLVILILGIVYAFRIPKFLRSTPREFGNCDPQVHALWRAKELGSIYVFLAATWGSGIVAILVAIPFAIVLANGPKEAYDALYLYLQGGQIVVFLGGLVWSGILGSQAAKLKKQLVYVVPGASYYPRPGQVTLQAPPPMPPGEVPPQIVEEPATAPSSEPPPSQS